MWSIMYLGYNFHGQSDANDISIHDIRFYSTKHSSAYFVLYLIVDNLKEFKPSTLFECYQHDLFHFVDDYIIKREFKISDHLPNINPCRGEMEGMIYTRIAINYEISQYQKWKGDCIILPEFKMTLSEEDIKWLNNQSDINFQ